jgi:glycosyltransferase involved in cell wall biosynthesis
VDEWVEALRTAAHCPEWVVGLRAKSLARAREFSWARTARRMRKVYEDARRRFGR